MKRSALILFALLSMPLAQPAIPDYGRGAARVAVGERRVALVIGNSGYRHINHLDNPGNDARLIAKTLKGLGFQLVGGDALLDLDRPKMEAAVQAFGRDLGADSVALFYYAGHGNEISGTNYLLPVDANPFKPSDFDFQTLNATTVLRLMQDAGTRLNIVILDACRDNPFSGRGLRGSQAGLGVMEPPEGTLIAYAAGIGKKAKDGPPNGNSPYTAALAKAMAESGLRLWDTFNTVGLTVKEDTGGVQTPWISNEPIKGVFCFAGCADATPLAAPEPSPAVKEQNFWDDIKNSQNPADFQAYLEQFPSGLHAGLAHNKVGAGSKPALEGSKPALQVGTGLEPAPTEQNPLPPGEGRVRVRKPTANSDSLTTNPFGIEMASLPGGSFQMGCGPKDGECEKDEKPRHAVTVKPFAIGKTEVTQGQWQAVMGSAPPELYFKDCGADCPVERVSWNDVQEFIQTLNQKTGAHYRLPSEAEWEYACRAGHDTLYCGGNDLGAVAWHGGNAGGKTHPVGGKAANPFGLYDMSGNVWEWLQDCYHDSYQGAPSDGSAWVDGIICASDRRAVRGGSWSGVPQNLRSASRDGGDPAYRYILNGFRLAQD